MMKRPFLLISVISLSSQQQLPNTALATEPTRSIEMRSAGWEGENHIRLSATATETDGASSSYPITTLDQSSFQVLFNGHAVEGKGISVIPFSATRRKNSRAMVWVYDATAVKTIKGLTGSLRALTAQTFPEFNPDYLSIVGVADGKSIERASFEPSQPSPPLSVQRLLVGQPKNIPSEAISTAHPLCVAERKFHHWQRRGLRESDQGAVILMGGAAPLPASEKGKVEQCERNLESMNVRIHQIVFAKPETFLERNWIQQRKKSPLQANYRVIELAGASRSLQAIKMSLDFEYELKFEVPQRLIASENEVLLAGTYHAKELQSKIFRLPPKPASAGVKTNLTLTEPKPEPPSPQRFVVLNHSENLAYEAWLEWLATAILIGFVATGLHIRRLHAGHITIRETSFTDEKNEGPSLVVLTGPNKGREYRIHQASTLIGSGWDCDIRLRAGKIKRRLGSLEIQGDKAILHDFSDGKIAVNGRHISAIRALGHGSVIRIGELQLLFLCGEA